MRRIPFLALTVAMWSLGTPGVLALGFPGPSGLSTSGLPTGGSVFSDFNNDGFADLAAGAPFEDAGSTPFVGAVSVLYGSAAKLTKTGGQIFTQNSPGIPSSAEPGDLLGIALATGDPHASTVAAAPSAPGSSAQRMASTR